MRVQLRATYVVYQVQTLNVGNDLYIACAYARRHKMSSTSSYTNFGRIYTKHAHRTLYLDIDRCRDCDYIFKK